MYYSLQVFKKLRKKTMICEEAKIYCCYYCLPLFLYLPLAKARISVDDNIYLPL